MCAESWENVLERLSKLYATKPAVNGKLPNDLGYQRPMGIVDGTTSFPFVNREDQCKAMLKSFDTQDMVLHEGSCSFSLQSKFTSVQFCTGLPGVLPLDPFQAHLFQASASRASLASVSLHSPANICTALSRISIRRFWR